MRSRTVLTLAVLVAAGAPLLARPSSPAGDPAAPASDARAQLDLLRAALESAVGRLAPMRLLPGAPAASRVYVLKGYGAVIALAPRTLHARRVVVRGAPRTQQRVVVSGPDLSSSDLRALEEDLERQMSAEAEALREIASAQQRASRQGEEELRRYVRLVQEQADAFRAEAERAREQAEHEVRIRLAPSALAPEPPEPPEPPPPPWRFWFEVAPEPEAAPVPPPADLIAAVHEAVADGLASYARPLSSLRDEEFVAVAVDIVSPAGPRASPPRTLIERVRARDLRERQAGRLTAAGLRQRIEHEEQ